MINSIAVEMVELAQFDHSFLAGSSGSRICRGGTELGDDRHQEPCQASAVTVSFGYKYLLYEDNAQKDCRRVSLELS
jgi:hypothetical protein